MISHDGRSYSERLNDLLESDNPALRVERFKERTEVVDEKKGLASVGVPDLGGADVIRTQGFAAFAESVRAQPVNPALIEEARRLAADPFWRSRGRRFDTWRDGQIETLRHINNALGVAAE